MKKIIIHYSLVSEPFNKRSFMGYYKNKEEAIKQILHNNNCSEKDINILEIIEKEI